MSVKDGVGNDLQEGDLVLVMLEKPFAIGRVSKLRDGGLSLADASGKAKNSPGIMQIICPQTIMYQPGPNANVPVLFKITNPNAQELVEEIAKQANSGMPANVTQMPATAKPPVES